MKQQVKALHLSKFARGVRGGAKVTQGQVIGYVGATGWATAPHLHYEFRLDGVHRNPLTFKTPKASAVSAELSYTQRGVALGRLHGAIRGHKTEQRPTDRVRVHHVRLP